MHSKYLTDIGLSDWIAENNGHIIERSTNSDAALEKLLQYMSHKHEYGIDPRECYDVEQTLYEYIYCLLKEYTQPNVTEVINLHYHTVEYNGVCWYQDEVIDRVLNAIKQWLRFKEESYPYYLGETLYGELKDSLHLFVEILFYMWW